MATWWTLTFEGEPTEADFARVSEMAAQGFTSGQLVSEAEQARDEAGCEVCGGPVRAGEGDGNVCGPCTSRQADR